MLLGHTDRNTDVPIDTLSFRSPINSENSWTRTTLSEDTPSTMALLLYGDMSGAIEWEMPELDMSEYIGLTFGLEPRDGKIVIVLTDYNGVFEIPEQAMDLIERNGICCKEMRESMRDA